MLSAGLHSPDVPARTPRRNRALRVRRGTLGFLVAGWTCVLGLARLVAAESPVPTSAASAPTTVSAAALHWAFQAPREPVLPPARQSAWPRSDLDRWVLAAMENQGLKPAPPADRRTLLRRATYDLLGLPPSLEEITAFEQDPDPDAFERVVDRLLASPRYGERWGRHWLDVVRYADTKGYVFYYEESQFVQAYRYRDWVIRAFNEDLPYDQFLRLQIAADQMAGPETSPALRPVATTYLGEADRPRPELAALGMLTLGRRFLGNPQDIIDDQLDVLMRGTQALTLGCARCHDHKFDPISMRDYYALYGVFQGSAEALAPLEARPRPDQMLPFAAAQAYVEFNQELKKRVERLESAFTAAVEQVSTRLRDRCADYLAAVVDRHRLPTVSANVRPAPEDLNPFNVRQWHRFLEQRRRGEDRVFGAWFALEGIAADDFAKHAAARLAAWKQIPEANPRVVAAFAVTPTNMVEVAQNYGRLLKAVDTEWRTLIARAPAEKSPLPTALPDPAAEAVRQVLYAPDAPVLPPPGSMVELDVHLYFDDPHRVALSKLQMEVERWVDQGPQAPAHGVILRDRQATPHSSPVLRRGDPTQPGELVAPRFLEVLGGGRGREFRAGSGRLELAQAIASPENPLTARVWVNRVWMHLFGVGLVRTPSDFGTRAEPPSHPELLDWLARRLIEDGWSTKQLHRRLLNSATYQQSSEPGPETAAEEAHRLAVDPENRLLSHAHRRRLDFESMRDALLAVSGELDLRSGGPAVDLESPSPTWRRTVYARVDRKFVPGVMRAFDFANPDVHAAQRFTTVVPQQALYLWNSPFLTQRARALARRSLDAAGVATSTVAREARVRSLYRLVLRREPSVAEVAIAREYLEEPVTPREPRADRAWSYGVGTYEAAGERVVGFAPLKTYRGGAWRPGDAWPDPQVGSVELTLDGGQASGTPAFAAVRRWTAERVGLVSLEGMAARTTSTGAALARVVSSRHGEMAATLLELTVRPVKVGAVRVEAGDTIDFVVEVQAAESAARTTNRVPSVGFVWAPLVRELPAIPAGRSAEGSGPERDWNARRDFAGPRPPLPDPLDGWEQLAQVLLVSNEFMFVE